VTRIPKSRPAQQLQAEDRRKEVVRLIGEKIPMTEIAERLGVAYVTVKRDKATLMQNAIKNNASQFEIWRAEHIAELEDLRTKLTDPLIDPSDKIALALAIIREDVRIKGTAAPTKSVSTTTSATFTVEPNFYRWAWNLFEHIPPESVAALRADCEAAAVKYRVAPKPFELTLPPAHILFDEGEEDATTK